MATFEAKVYRLTIEPHPNADLLELAAVGDYRAVVGKDLYKTGDFGVYIQEGSLVPKWLCEKYDWKLAGPDANRVKAMKLRGILSQGIVVPLRDGTIYNQDYAYPDGCDGHLTLEDGSEVDVESGQDVAELLGVVKYEPPIPVHMAGEVFNAHGYTLSYDIENIKKYPDTFVEGEEVVMTEKLHGTWTCLGHNVNLPGYKIAVEHGTMLILQPVTNCKIVTSKGMSGQGLAFKFNDANVGNLYMRSLQTWHMEQQNQSSECLTSMLVNLARDIT
jgi:RNA ligase (TIGR02306 family)